MITAENKRKIKVRAKELVAQMSAEEKNAISHRGRAVRKLAEFLQNL